MILRRFTKHVTDQNWFAVGLDVIVVITGIFLGMQVTEWNEVRKGKIEEQQYLKRLLVDMKQSDTLQKNQLQRLNDLIPKQHIALAILLDGTLKPENRPDFEYAISYASDTTARPLTIFGTINELQSSGKLLLIRDDAIKISISGLQQSYNLTYDMMKNVQRAQTPMQTTLTKNFIYYVDGNQKEVFEYDFKELTGNRAYVSDFSISLGYMEFLRRALNNHNEITVKFAVQLEESLKEGDTP